MNTFEFNGKEIQLHRIPQSHSASLRAWDAADEYALEHCQNEGLLDAKNALVVNDTFGALAIGLHPIPLASWSDSHLARLALEHNLELNGISSSQVSFYPGNMMPQADSTQPHLDLVILKVPKSMSWLSHTSRPLNRENW